MGKYILLRKIDVANGFRDPYSAIFESDDIVKIEEEIKKRVKDGCAVSKFRIVQDVPFEFKCAIALKKDEEFEAEWTYWPGWAGNHDRRIDDATCSKCGYKHPVVRGSNAPEQLADHCPKCGRKMRKNET